MRILLTGGAGFIGRHVIEELANLGHETASFDAYLNFCDKSEYYKNCLEVRNKYLKHKPSKEYKGDIRQLKSLKRAIRDFKPEIIIHLAGLPMARINNHFKNEMSPINMQGTLNVFKVFEESDARKLVYTSSSMAYGHFKQTPQSENFTLDPVNEYGACKAAGEYFVKLSNKEWTIVRPTSVYGLTDCANRVTQILLDNAFLGKPSWVIKGETLDFSYIKDVADGFTKCILKPIANHQIFNISSGEARAVSEFAEIVKKYFPKFKYEIKEPVDHQVWRGPLDISKACLVLKYQPHYSIEDGIKEYIELAKKYAFYDLI